MPTLADLRLFARYHLTRRPARGPERERALGIVPLGYDARAYEAALRAHEPRLQVSRAAEISHDGSAYPTFSVVARSASARARVLVLGGVHGNEHAGILAVPEALGALAGQEALRHVELHVLAPVNPVGAAHLSRLNGDGYDINRDFVRFATAEGRLVRDTLTAARPTFVVSLHEGPQDDTFFFANEHVDRALALRLRDALARGGTLLATRDYLGRRLDPPGIAPSSRGQVALMRLWAALGMQTTNGYCGASGRPEITLESSWRSADRDERVRAHVGLLVALVRELAAQAQST